MSTLAELEARIAALEQRATLPPSYAPASGMVVAPDGTVSYDFDGHVHAQGLDLDAGEQDSPPADRKVRWLRTTNGEEVAELNGTADAEHLVSKAQMLAPLLAGFTKSQVQAKAGIWNVVVIGSDQKSSFVQVGGINLTRLGGALISAAGAITAQSPSAAITGLSHPSVGTYVLTFSTSPAARYLVPVVLGAAGAVATLLTTTANTATYQTTPGDQSVFLLFFEST